MHRESGRKTTDVKQTTDQEPVEAEKGEITHLLETARCKIVTLVSQ